MREVELDNKEQDGGEWSLLREETRILFSFLWYIQLYLTLILAAWLQI